MTDTKWSKQETVKSTAYGTYHFINRTINNVQFTISYRDTGYGVLQKYDIIMDTFIYVGVGAVSTLKKKALAMSK